MKRKRVEYQKYIRTKLEQERYREHFGLTENIMLEGEEDLVLQREFRIDFVLQKATDAWRICWAYGKKFVSQFQLLAFFHISSITIFSNSNPTMTRSLLFF